MQIELSAEEIHWLKYSVMMAIANLPDGDADLGVVYESVLEKLNDPLELREANRSSISVNLFEPLKPPEIYVLDHSQEREYRV